MLALIRTALAVLVFVTTFAASSGANSPRTGAEIYSANCAACHGADGKGAPKSSVGFDVPLPDFSDCVFTTPETDADWAATIHLGGAARAFNRKMPAFVDALSNEEIDLAIRSLHHTTFMMYFLWDWFDGGLLDGWR